MRKILPIGLALVLVIGLATTVILYAHNPGYYRDADIKTDVKKIDKGVQITVTAEDPEITKYIQENGPWYADILRYGGHHRYPYGGWRYRGQHGCGAWPW